MITAQAALSTERGESVVLSEVHLREPLAGEILVRIVASGVCATDLFGMDGGAGDIFPAVFGHEGAGIVIEVGADITAVSPGDHVILSFDSCGVCVRCTSGHPTSCLRFSSLNQRPRRDQMTMATGEAVTSGWMSQSAWANYVIATERNAVVIPHDVPWEVAAALGCGVLTGAGTAINALAPGHEDVALIVGAGTTGLSAVMACAHRGVRTIIVCEPDPTRRALAAALGATTTAHPDELSAALEHTGRATHALDTVGAQSSIDAALGALESSGVCVTVALRAGENRVSVSQSSLLWGRSIRGVIEGDAAIQRDIPRLVALWRSGRLPVEKLIRRYPFADAATAIADARSGDAIKAVLLFDDGDTSPSAPIAQQPLAVALDGGHVPDADLGALWRSLPAVRPEELGGLWRGHAVTRDHPTGDLLQRTQWFGKQFFGADDVVPIVSISATGELWENREQARGGATLARMEHDGLSTAAMVYDRMPVIDLFVRIDAQTLLGVMTGRGTRHNGNLFYFTLHQESPRSVTRAQRPHR